MLFLTLLDAQTALIEGINAVLQARGWSVRAAALKLGLPVRSVQNVLDGHVPGIDRAEKICRGLGLRIELGALGGAGDGWPALPPGTKTHLWGDRRGKEVTPYPVPIRDTLLSGKAGFSPNGCAYFGLDFLLDFDLNPKLCEVVEIYDDSMAPEFPAGAVALVDLRRRELVDGRVSALGVPELTVRRMRKHGGRWMAVADNREFEGIRWSDRFAVVGQVVWTSHMVDVGLAVGGEGGAR